MKKIFNIIFTTLLIYFSFYYANLVSNYVKNKDPIMIKLKEVKDSYQKEAVDAVIANNTIIPGISGLEVDVDESYLKMKKVGNFQESLLVFKKVDSNISLKNNFDKLIISGNINKNNVSVLLKIDNLEIIEALKKEDYFPSLNFIFNKDFLIDEENTLKELENNIVVLEDQVFDSSLIDYCYTTKEFKNICQEYLKYTFKVEMITHDYYYNTYQVIKNGSIIAFQIINEKNITDLDILINGIKNLGFKIVSLDELIKE